jgi:hypothetical protein
MEKTIVFQNENATMVFYPVVNIVHNTFRGKPTGKQFREALDAGVEVMKKHGSTKWLSDDRENEVVFSAEDNAWADSDWFPRMQKVGWKTWAMVVPQTAKARMNVKEIIDKIYQQGVRVAVFSDLNEALAWLIKVD